MEQDKTGSADYGWSFEKALQIKSEIDPLLASWVRIFDHHAFGEPGTEWSFWKDYEALKRDKIQEYYHHIWLDGLLCRTSIDNLLDKVAVTRLFSQTQPVTPPTQQEIDAAIEKRRLAAEKRGVKPSDRHAIRRNHIIENESGDIPIV